MLRGDQVVINGDGEQERDFVYVGDCAKANLAAIQASRGMGILNLGSGQGTTVNEIFEKLRDITGYARDAKHGPAKLGETSKIYLDASKARREMGWQPTMNLEDGLRKTVEYFRRMEVTA
jgi:UDP-glucose 4-epimerase